MVLYRAMNDFTGRDCVSIRDFDRAQIDAILDAASHYEGEHDRMLQDKVMATLFFEPSTRTRLSFESAMHRLGGRVIGFATDKVSSAVKGETLADAVRVLEGYADVIVLRHPLEGSARVAAEATAIPVINGGDGANQHPTQTFLDLYTIRQQRGRLAALKVGFLGDLRYGRTVHSLASALALYGTKMTFVAPPFLRMPSYLLDSLAAEGIDYTETEMIEPVIGDLDVLYVTRIQKERFGDPLEYEKVQGAYRVDRALIEQTREEFCLLHPLPRVDEIATEVDDLPQAHYFRQAHNGVTVRKALLAMVLGRHDHG